MLFRPLFVAVLLFTTPAWLVVESRAATAEQVVASYSAAIKAGGMAAAAKLVHPDDQTMVRTAIEPLVVAGLKKRSTRELYADFADPYNLSTMMKLTDEQFLGVFMKWVERQQPQKFEFQKKAQFIPLGHVDEGEVQHVVTRLSDEVEGQKIEQVLVFSTKTQGNSPLLLLPWEFREIVLFLSRKR